MHPDEHQVTEAPHYERVLYCHVAPDERRLLISYQFHGHELLRPGWQEKNVENIMPLRPVHYSMPLCGSLISHLRMQIFSWSPCLP